MKKIFTYISLVAVAALAASCDMNKEPVFNDADAFVAFDKAAFTCKESDGSIQIPVTLASVAGISTTVSYAAVDGTAVAGTDFELAEGKGTLTFTADARTQYITVNIIEHPGVYTGDLKFSLEFKSTGDVNSGFDNKCTITILDNDHPLASILNTYKATGKSYFNGEIEWEMTLEKDAKDVAMVWFSQLVGGVSGFYGIVTMTDGQPTSIAIPMGQISAVNTTSSGDGNIYLYGLSNDMNLNDEGNIIVTIKDNGATLEFDNDWGPCANAGGTNSYFDLVYPGIVATKK